MINYFIELVVRLWRLDDEASQFRGANQRRGWWWATLWLAVIFVIAGVALISWLTSPR